MQLETFGPVQLLKDGAGIATYLGREPVSGAPLRLKLTRGLDPGSLVHEGMTLRERLGAGALELTEWLPFARALAQSVQEVQEHERQLLVAELHDGLSQGLAALLMELRVSGAPAEQFAQLNRELKTLMLDLRSPVAEGDDLVAAIRELAASLPIPCELSLPPEGSVSGLPAYFGLKGMRLRAELVGGTLVESAAGRGTTVRFSLPVEAR